jgi:hypothetical protein
MQEFMELVNFRITEGSDYGWECYGPDAYMLDSWDGDHDGASFTIIFDTKTQEVYEVQAHDYRNQRAYRMLNPDFMKKMKKEAKKRHVSKKEAWDDVDYVDLDVDADWLGKAEAIIAGEDYDTRVQVEVDFSDEDLLQYMKLAHKRDITFNQLVEEALRFAIEEVEAGRLTKEDAQNFVLESNGKAWPFKTTSDEEYNEI